jgi:Fic family protein
VSANPPRFRNRSEKEFAGCRATLDSFHQQDPGTLSIGLILHLHRLLFSFVDGGGGRFKLDDNLVINRHDDGTTTTRFAPVSVAETEYYVTELVDRTNEALAAGVVHPVLITAAFGLDLLCIHPFADGNGRVARLMTTYLMSRSGYGVGRYVSLEQVIYETKDDYYAALGASTTGSRQAPMVERNRTGFATSCCSTPRQRFRSRTISGWGSAVEVGGFTGSRGGCFGRRPLDESVRLRLNALL